MEICGKLGPRRRLVFLVAVATRGDQEAGSSHNEGAGMLAACSACSGDYEDPDRTVWVADGDEVEDAGTAETGGEGFPAES